MGSDHRGNRSYGRVRFSRLRAGPVAAGCLAFLYAMQPDVFTRNISHFNLLRDLVPLLATVCLEVATGRWETGKPSAFREIPPHGWVGFVLQGISFFDFSFFGALLLLVAAFYGACHRRTLRPLMHGAWLLAVLAVASIAGVSPTLLHWMQHGANPAAVQRSAAEAEVHGLRIRHLLTPVPQHPLAFMRRLSDIAQAKHQDQTEASTTRLGLLGAAGFVALMAYLCSAGGMAMAARRRHHCRLRRAGIGCIPMVHRGGFGSIFNTFVMPVTGRRSHHRIFGVLDFGGLWSGSFRGFGEERLGRDAPPGGRRGPGPRYRNRLCR